MRTSFYNDRNDALDLIFTKFRKKNDFRSYFLKTSGACQKQITIDDILKLKRNEIDYHNTSDLF